MEYNQHFQSIFPMVQVFNLHEEEGDNSSSLSPTNQVMANYLCHMIPEAQQACMAARANTLVPPDNKRKWNPFMDNLDAYLIAERTSGPKNSTY
jgi:hypothetical protein